MKQKDNEDRSSEWFHGSSLGIRHINVNIFLFFIFPNLNSKTISPLAKLLHIQSHSEPNGVSSFGLCGYITRLPTPTCRQWLGLCELK